MWQKNKKGFCGSREIYIWNLKEISNRKKARQQKLRIANSQMSLLNSRQNGAKFWNQNKRRINRIKKWILNFRCNTQRKDSSLNNKLNKTSHKMKATIDWLQKIVNTFSRRS